MNTQRLVVASNSLPVAAARGKDGAWSLLPGSGGLVTALAPVLEARGGLWGGWPGLIGDANDEIKPLLEGFAQHQGYDLVLSEFAGAAVQLGDGALLVNPYDILGVAAAIAQACEMPIEERKRRMVRLQRSILTENVHRWVDNFLGHAQVD